MNFKKIDKKQLWLAILIGAVVSLLLYFLIVFSFQLFTYTLRVDYINQMEQLYTGEIPYSVDAEQALEVAAANNLKIVNTSQQILVLGALFVGAFIASYLSKSKKILASMITATAVLLVVILIIVISNNFELNQNQYSVLLTTALKFLVTGILAGWLVQCFQRKNS